MKAKKVTFADIAAYTGFSKTTISRYFNNPDSLTLENQQKIADALVALDYKENKVGRILASGQTEFVGIIIPNLYMHYYSEMLSQILSTYETYGYKFLVFSGNDKADVERRYIEELLAYNIEGMIILSPTISSRELASCRKYLARASSKATRPVAAYTLSAFISRRKHSISVFSSERA